MTNQPVDGKMPNQPDGMTPRTQEQLAAKPKREIPTILTSVVPVAQDLLNVRLPAVKAALEANQYDLDHSTTAMAEVKRLQSDLTECLNILSQVRGLIATDLERSRRDRARARKGTK